MEKKILGNFENYDEPVQADVANLAMSNFRKKKINKSYPSRFQSLNLLDGLASQQS